MRRFRLLLRNELKLFRTTVPLHLVVIFQPMAMYLLMSVILVHPTFDMNVGHPSGAIQKELVEELKNVGSPIGDPYINPVIVDWQGGEVSRQIIAVKEMNGTPTAVQYYELIDSNLVKNFRNRLKAAALQMWNKTLDGRAVTIEQHAWLPKDVSYNVYFGMALIAMTAFLAASVLGAALTAQEFELRTVVEYRLAPLHPGLILGARLTRLILSAFLSAAVLILTVGLVTGAWPEQSWYIGLILLPIAIVAGCLGIVAGLQLRKTIPAFLTALVASFVGWIMGSSFGLAAGFGTGYERISRLTPFTHVVELLFPRYYGVPVGKPAQSILALILMAAGMTVLTTYLYRRRILRQE